MDPYLPDTHSQVFQQSSHNQYNWFAQQPQLAYPLNSTHLLPSPIVMGAQTPYPPMSPFYQSYEEMLTQMQQYYYPDYFMHNETHPWPSVAMSSTQPQPHPPSTLELQAENKDVLIGPQSGTTAALPGSTSNISSFPLCNPSFTQVTFGAFTQPTDLKIPVEVSQKTTRRLVKNCKAVNEYRQRKKNYIKCLEDRVVELENENKSLITEIRALINIYQHKAK